MRFFLFLHLALNASALFIYICAANVLLLVFLVYELKYMTVCLRYWFVMTIFVRIHLVTPQITPGTEIDKLYKSLDQYTPDSKVKKLISHTIDSRKEFVALRNKYRNVAQTSENRGNTIKTLKSTLKKHAIPTDKRMENNNFEELSQSGQYNRARRFGPFLTHQKKTIGSKNVVKEIDKHAKKHNYIKNLSKAPNMQIQNTENYEEALEQFQNDPDRHIMEVIKCALRGKSKKEHISDRSTYGLKNELLLDPQGFAFHKQAESQTLPNGYKVPKPIDRTAFDIARDVLIEENNALAPWIVNNVDNNANLFEGYRDAYNCAQNLLQILHESLCCAGHVPFHHFQFKTNDFKSLNELSNQKVLNIDEIDIITHLFRERLKTLHKQKFDSTFDTIVTKYAN